MCDRFVQSVRTRFSTLRNRCPYRLKVVPPATESFRQPRFWQALGVEVLGTFFYVLLASGSWLESGGNPGPPATVQVAVTLGLAYAALLYALGHISGAHLNPVVTLAACITRKMCLARALAYTAAQFFGAILGAAFALGIAPDYSQTDLAAQGLPVNTITDAKPGATYISAYSVVSAEKGFAVEFFATFFFIFIVTATKDVEHESGAASAAGGHVKEALRPSAPDKELVITRNSNVPERPQRTKKGERTGTAPRTNKQEKTAEKIDKEKAKDVKKVGENAKTERDLMSNQEDLPQILTKEKDAHTALMVGLTHMAALMFAIPSSGGGLNPARSLGPALCMRAWNGHWIYWFGPILGGLAGALTYDIVFAKHASLARVRSCMLKNEKEDQHVILKERRDQATKERLHLISQRTAEVAAAEEVLLKEANRTSAAEMTEIRMSEV